MQANIYYLQSAEHDAVSAKLQEFIEKATVYSGKLERNASL
jgi:hypothetical protein